MLPLVAGLLADVLAVAGDQDLAGDGAAGHRLLLGALVADDGHAARVLREFGAADGIRLREPDEGLRLVRQAQHRGARSVLGESAQGRGAGLEGGEAPALVDPLLGERTDAHGHRGDHSQGSLGAEDQLTQVGSGRRARGPAGLQGAFRRGDRQTEDHLVEAAVPGGRLAAGAGRGEASDGRPFEGLREVSEGPAALVEQRLALGAAQTGLQCRGAGHLVDGEQPVESAQVERDERPLRGGREAADDGGAAAEGHGDDGVVGAGTEHGEDLVVVAREHDGRGDVVDLAGADAQQVGGRLSAGVPDTALGVLPQALGRADGRPQRGAGLFGQRRGGRFDVGEGGRTALARGDSEQVTQQAGHRVGQGCRLGRVAPTAPQHVHFERVPYGLIHGWRCHWADAGITL